MDIRKILFENQDLEYKSFHKNIVPTVDEQRIIGVRMPVMRKIAKDAVKCNIQIASPYYYEEFMIKGLMIGYTKRDINEYFELLDEFVPLIDNWAVCDSVCSNCKFIKKYKDETIEYLAKYLHSSNEYELRFAIIVLMDYFIDDDYSDRIVEILSGIRSDFYYVNMAIAWAFSFIYIKYPEKIMPLIKSKQLTRFIQNKTISKICDSYRVTKEDKQYLKQFRL